MLKNRHLVLRCLCSFVLHATCYSIVVQYKCACIQDEQWQKRNREAINSIEVGYSTRHAQQAVAAAQRELAELAAHHRPTGRDDSVLGSWFFIEKFTISNIHSNVTINLSSNIVAKAQLLNVQVRCVAGCHCAVWPSTIGPPCSEAVVEHICEFGSHKSGG